MADIDATKFKLVWEIDAPGEKPNHEVRALHALDYTCIYQHTVDWRGHAYTYWLMAPPEPPEPKLAEQARYCAIRLRGHAATAAYGDLVDTMADALERLTKIEQAARYAVDHQTECGVVERLRNALER